MFQEYGKLSTELYEHTKPVGYSIDGDLAYYLEQAKKANGKVLEAGVGTGRLLIPFIEQGIDMEGVDLSPFMLEKCQENLDSRGLHAPLYEQDITTLDLPHRYDLIMMPTGSFALLPTREIMLNGLKSFKKHLNPGGKLIVDLLLPKDFTVGESSSSIFQLTPEEGILFNSTSLEIDWENQRTTEVHRYEKWRNGELVGTELSRFILSWYGVEEFRLILDSLGFSNIRVVWDYEKETGQHETLTFFAEAN